MWFIQTHAIDKFITQFKRFRFWLCLHIYHGLKIKTGSYIKEKIIIKFCMFFSFNLATICSLITHLKLTSPLSSYVLCLLHWKWQFYSHFSMKSKGSNSKNGKNLTARYVMYTNTCNTWNLPLNLKCLGFNFAHIFIMALRSQSDLKMKKK